MVSSLMRVATYPDASADEGNQSSAVDSQHIVGIGCLFIPLIIAAWWYWTKRQCKKVVLCIKNECHPVNEDISSSSNDDETYYVHMV